MAGTGQRLVDLGRESPVYHATGTATGYRFNNPTHAFGAELTSAGLSVRTPAGQWGLQLRGYGYGNDLTTANEAGPQATANRVEYVRGALTEWYVNGPVGLEQGFTIATAPAHHSAEPLTVALAVTGDLRAEIEEGQPAAKGLTLHSSAGKQILGYRGVSAYDGRGKELPAWVELGARTLRLRVDDRGAEYPIVVDPFVQQAQLTASDPGTYDDFGISVAIDGDTVVVGAFSDDIGANSDQGSAYVFEKSGSSWSSMTEIAKLTASDGAAFDQFGSFVSISGDTVVVGAIYDDIGANTDQGSAYVFVKPGSGWSSMTETAKLTASDGAGFDRLGNSVSVSGDTVVVAAFEADVGSNTNQGAAYVFEKPGGGWTTTTETAKLTASDGEAFDYFANSVAVSGDAVVVGVQYDYIEGSAYVFVKPGGGWITMTETAKLTASDARASDRFGSSVAISGDTLVVGANGDDLPSPFVNFNHGSAYVFVKPGGGWMTTTETAKLHASDAYDGDGFGDPVAIDGDTVVVGVDPDSTGSIYSHGSAYVFVEPGGGWVSMTETAKLTAADAAAYDLFGESIAISGGTMVVGARYHDVGANVDQGSVYVFEDVPAPPTPTPTTTPTITATQTATATVALAECAPTPLSGCATSSKGLLKLKQAGSSRKLIWKWGSGTVDWPEFGNPLATTSYRLCVYDDGALKMDPLIAPHSFDWEFSGTAFKYSNPSTNAAGIFKVMLKSGTGNAKILVKGKGTNLQLPFPAGITHDTAVTVQLVKDAGSGNECWGAVFLPPNTRSDSEQFNDKLP